MGITGSRRRVSLGASKALHSVRTDSKLFGDLLQARAPRRWLDYLPGAGGAIGGGFCGGAIGGATT
jgi:hypothetical protein